MTPPSFCTYIILYQSSLSLSLSLSILITKYKLDLKCLLTILKFQLIPSFISSFFTVFNSLYMHCNFQFKWWVLTILAISDYRLPRKLASLTLWKALTQILGQWSGCNILEAGSKFLLSMFKALCNPRHNFSWCFKKCIPLQRYKMHVHFVLDFDN